MPRYGRRRFTYARKRKRGGFRYQKRIKARKSFNRRAVKGRARNIQSAVKAPMSRMIMFEDTRSYIVEDNSGDATAGPEPIQRIIELNDPHNTFPTATTPPEARALQGTWTACDFAAKGSAMPGVSKWVTKKDGTGPGQYRMATATSTKVTVTCTPLDETAGEDPKTFQAVTKLFVKKVTKLSDATQFMNKRPDASFNCDQMARQQYTRTADMVRVDGGRNKGATITTNYNFNRMNSGPGRATINHFFADASPTELDFLHIGILPTNASYGLNTERCGKYRVVIQMQTLAHLSEPNTDGTIWGESDGNSMEQIKRRYTTMMGGDTVGDDE